MREIQAKFQASAGAAGSNSSSATTSGTTTGGGGGGGGGVPSNAGASLHPPPIPVRRNAASAPQPQPRTSPPTQPVAQPRPAARRQDKNTNNSGNSKPESRSAPSSPTEKSSKKHGQESRDPNNSLEVEAGSGSGQGSPATQRASPGRPKSVAVTGDQNVKYTTVSFVEENHAPPPARRNTTYSDIKHQQQPKPDNSLDGDTRPISPSYVSVGVCPHTQLSEDKSQGTDESEDPMYDVPPPPVPIRFSSQEGVHESAANAAATKVNTEATKEASDDPFSHSQFGDPFSDDAWNDPTAFYDKPRSVSASGVGSELLEDGYLEIGNVSTSATGTADFTGDSSYEDTSSFLQDIRARYKNRLPETMMAAGQHHHQLCSIQADNDSTAMYDLPPKEMESKTSSTMAEDDVQMGSYDFPAALNLYPLKEDEGSGEDPGAAAGGKRREEPPLHAVQYPIQKLAPSSQQSGGVGGPSSATVSRSESFPRGLRVNVPLPPTPTQQNANPKASLERSGREDPPPLPARQQGSTSKPFPGKDGHTPPSNDRPLLPPMNHPWGNKRLVNQPLPSSRESHDPINPPLPPRKKVQGNTNGHPQLAEGAGQTTENVATHGESAILDLISKGYQRADIESALRIARNDYELAKSILKEFGGRN